MLTVPGATAPPQNLPKDTPGTKVLFCSPTRRHKPCFPIVLSELKPRKDRAETTRGVGVIKIVAIAAPAALGFRALSRQLRSSQPRLRLKMTMIAINQYDEKIKTWARPLVTIVTRRAILPTNTLSLRSQTTSIGLCDFLVSDCCYYGGFEGKSFRQGPLYLLPISSPQE